jgi:hypothetical protein
MVLQGVVYVQNFVEHSVLLVQVLAHLRLHGFDSQCNFNRLLDLHSFNLIVALDTFETLKHDNRPSFVLLRLQLCGQLGDLLHQIRDLIDHLYRLLLLRPQNLLLRQVAVPVSYTALNILTNLLDFTPQLN